MKLPRLFTLVLFPSASLLLAVVNVYSFGPQIAQNEPQYLSALTAPANVDFDSFVATPSDGGIREEVPERLKTRFAKWKAELISTDFGRAQWERYANDSRFILKITVAEKRHRGARTDAFRWNTEGKLVGATITIGSRLDEGYPDPIYYPVLNSLSASASHDVTGSILAAAKLSHELAHVEQAASSEMDIFRLRERLIPLYTSILRRNGRNVQAAELVEISRQMGGTPVQIAEAREYHSESIAMHYLRERIAKEAFLCTVFGRIKRNVERYARGHKEAFGLIDPSIASVCEARR